MPYTTMICVLQAAYTHNLGGNDAALPLDLGALGAA